MRGPRMVRLQSRLGYTQKSEGKGKREKLRCGSLNPKSDILTKLTTTYSCILMTQSTLSLSLPLFLWSHKSKQRTSVEEGRSIGEVELGPAAWAATSHIQTVRV